MTNYSVEGRNKTIEEFTKELVDEIKSAVEHRYGFSVNPEATMVLKNNGEQKALIMRIADNDRIAPTIYTEDLYRDFLFGKDIPDIADQVGKVVYNAHVNSPELPKLTAEEAMENITLTLANTKMNKKLLENTPHFEILDGELSAVPRWYISDVESFVVSNEVAGSMGLTSDEVLQIGQHHIDGQTYTVRTMQEVLSEMMGEEIPPMECPPLYVVTSENRIQGSNALLSHSTLDEVHQKIGDCVILPSSVHELLLLPVDKNMNPDDLRAMVHGVNISEVRPEERLSDQIFHFDGQKLRLVGDTLDMAEPQIEAPKMDSHRMSIAM